MSLEPAPQAAPVPGSIPGASVAEAPRALRSAAGWAAFCAAYLATYFVSTAVPTPLLWYLPLERRFAFAVRPLGLAADYYGRLLLCLLVGAVAMGISRAIFRNASEARLARTLRTLGAWTIALLVFTAAMYVYLLVGRSGFPVPLPPGYEPR